MNTILVIDDEASVLQAFDELLSSLGYAVVTARNAEAGLHCIRERNPDIVVTDLCMPGMHGLDALRRMQNLNPKLPVIIMTGQGTMNTAIEATKSGAFDYYLKPFEPESMVSAVERALQSVRLMRRNVQINPVEVATAADALVGDSPEMQEVFKAIGRVAATNATVLILGESGTGKELVARAIYQHSQRGGAPLIVVNCAAIPENLLESELFGHERGAFTGATSRKIGKFQQADKGTIFLDEIGDIPLNLQAKLLRALQQKTFQPLGGTETIQGDVRVLAATNRNLEAAIANGKFREDLFHRLNVFSISIPQLRERRSDIPKLVAYFLQRYSTELGIPLPIVSDEAQILLQTADWPGNVRELEHCIYRAMIFTRGYPIQKEDILRAREASSSPTGVPTPTADERTLRDFVSTYLDRHGGSAAHEKLLAKIERLLIDEALHRTNGNQTQAALLLGLTRPTLHAKIQRMNVAPPSP